MRSKRLKKVLLAAMSLTGLLFISCVGNSPLESFISVDSNHLSTSPNGTATIGDARFLKKGEDCSFTAYIVNIFWYGPGESISDAMEDGKITRIASIDRSSVRVGGIVYNNCVIVYGE